MRNKILSVCIFLLCIVLGAGIMWGIINIEPRTVEKILENRNVTITDTGIAEAVDKIYNSVVVVHVSNNTSSGYGSGFIYKIDGDTTYIVTNHHVIENSKKIEIEFMDDELGKVEGTLVGSDAFTDVAVVKIKTIEGLKTVEIGSVDKLNLGDTVFTVGTPVDVTFKGTITRGVVSGVERLVPINVQNSYIYDYLMRAIQTDATINNGNSGGPLCNANGEVIGINTMKMASVVLENMGFAVVIDEALPLIEEIISTGKVDRPYVGVSTYELSSAKYLLGRDANISDDVTGIYVAEVEKDSPADKGGLKSKDIITKIEDTKITSMAEFKYYLYQNKPKNKVKLTIIRDGKEKEVSIELASK